VQNVQVCTEYCTKTWRPGSAGIRCGTYSVVQDLLAGIRGKEGEEKGGEERGKQRREQEGRGKEGKG